MMTFTLNTSTFPSAEAPHYDFVVEVTPRSRMVPRHSSGEFTCTIRSFVPEAPTRVLWMRQDGDPLPYDIYDDGHGLLTFRDAHPSHEGVYVCRTEPETQVTDTITLTIGEIPTTPEPVQYFVTVSLSSLNLEEGQSSEIYCNVKSIPRSEEQVRIRWSKEGETRLPFGVQDDGRGRLAFRNVGLTSSGIYVCSIDADPSARASSNVVVTERGTGTTKN